MGVLVLGGTEFVDESFVERRRYLGGAGHRVRPRDATRRLPVDGVVRVVLTTMSTCRAGLSTGPDPGRFRRGRTFVEATADDAEVEYPPAKGWWEVGGHRDVWRSGPPAAAGLILGPYENIGRLPRGSPAWHVAVTCSRPAVSAHSTSRTGRWAVVCAVRQHVGVDGRLVHRAGTRTLPVQ